MEKKNSTRGKLGKGKKVAIIAGCAAAGEAVVGIGAAIAAPFTGGATAPIAAALLTKSAKDMVVALGVGAIVGGGVGVVATKVADSKRESQAYGDGYNDASKAYESKFAKQAEDFAQKQEEWAQAKKSWEHTQEEKDELLRKCIVYIKDLETERDSLKAENKMLSAEKQELLERLYGIRDKLRVV